MIPKIKLVQCARCRFTMPIEITTNELTADHKRDVRKEFTNIVDSLDSEQLESYEYLIKTIENIGSGKSRFKKELSNYLMAISMYLNIPESKDSHSLNNVFFERLYEKQLLAALIYFINPDDIIPDHIAYIGYLDDAYCVNLALSKQSPEVRNKIENIVAALTVLEN